MIFWPVSMSGACLFIYDSISSPSGFIVQTYVGSHKHQIFMFALEVDKTWNLGTFTILFDPTQHGRTETMFILHDTFYHFLAWASVWNNVWYSECEYINSSWRRLTLTHQHYGQLEWVLCVCHIRIPSNRFCASAISRFLHSCVRVNELIPKTACCWHDSRRMFQLNQKQL